MNSMYTVPAVSAAKNEMNTSLDFISGVGAMSSFLESVSLFVFDAG